MATGCPSRIVGSELVFKWEGGARDSGPYLYYWRSKILLLGKVRQLFVIIVLLKIE